MTRGGILTQGSGLVHVHGIAAGKTNGSLSRQKRFPEEYHQLMPETVLKGTQAMCMYRKFRKVATVNGHIAM